MYITIKEADNNGYEYVYDINKWIHSDVSMHDDIYYIYCSTRFIVISNTVRCILNNIIILANYSLLLLNAHSYANIC